MFATFFKEYDQSVSRNRVVGGSCPLDLPEEGRGPFQPVKSVRKRTKHAFSQERNIVGVRTIL